MPGILRGVANHLSPVQTAAASSDSSVCVKDLPSFMRSHSRIPSLVVSISLSPISIAVRCEGMVAGDGLRRAATHGPQRIPSLFGLSAVQLRWDDVSAQDLGQHGGRRCPRNDQGGPRQRHKLCVLNGFASAVSQLYRCVLAIPR